MHVKMSPDSRFVQISEGLWLVNRRYTNLSPDTKAELNIWTRRKSDIQPPVYLLGAFMF